MKSSKEQSIDNIDLLITKLENMILSGVFGPRERLPEIKLSNELGVSRAWIRNALKVLETKGLIQIIPYKGAIVSDLQEDEIEEIFEVRTVIEALAARKASLNIQKKDFVFLERLVKQFEESAKHDDFDAMIQSNDQFHDYILELCQNRTLQQMIKQLQARCHVMRWHAWSSKEAIERIQQEHWEFIKGLKNRDFELLDDLSKRHIAYSKDSYILQIRVKRIKLSVNE